MTGIAAIQASVQGTSQKGKNKQYNTEKARHLLLFLDDTAILFDLADIGAESSLPPDCGGAIRDCARGVPDN